VLLKKEADRTLRHSSIDNFVSLVNIVKKKQQLVIIYIRSICVGN